MELKLIAQIVLVGCIKKINADGNTISREHGVNEDEVRRLRSLLVQRWPKAS